MNPSQLDFSVTQEVPGGETLVRPEFSISHEYDVDQGVIEGRLYDWMERSEENPDVLYFPGTFNEDGGGYYHTVMPVIKDGEVIDSRKKVQPNYDIHDWLTAASTAGDRDAHCLLVEAENTLENSDNTYMQRGNAVEIDSVLYTGPKGDVQQDINDIAREEARDTVETIEHFNLEILPVICNEIRRIGEHLDGRPDLVVEASYDLPEWRSDYQAFLDETGMDSVQVVRADGANPGESGFYEVEADAVAEVEIPA